MEYIFEICTCAVLLFGFCIYKIYHYRLKDNLFKKVSWCVRTDEWLIEHRLYSKLLFYSGHNELYNQHLEQMTDKKYALDINNNAEKKMVIKILDDYRADLSEKYLNQVLGNSRLVRSLDDFHYFILTLLNYLEDKKLKETVAGEKIRGKIILKHSHNDNTYELTDFGVVFIKLYYWVRSYAEKAPAFEGEIFKDVAQTYKENIEKRSIRIAYIVP